MEKFSLCQSVVQIGESGAMILQSLFNYFLSSVSHCLNTAGSYAGAIQKGQGIKKVEKNGRWIWKKSKEYPKQLLLAETAVWNI